MGFEEELDLRCEPVQQAKQAEEDGDVGED